MILLGTFLSLALIGAIIIAQFYGIYVCFKKNWICGFLGIVFPVFSFVVGAAKLCGFELIK